MQSRFESEGGQKKVKTKGKYVMTKGEIFNLLFLVFVVAYTIFCIVYAIRSGNSKIWWYVLIGFSNSIVLLINQWHFGYMKKIKKILGKVH